MTKCITIGLINAFTYLGAYFLGAYDSSGAIGIAILAVLFVSFPSVLIVGTEGL